MDDQPHDETTRITVRAPEREMALTKALRAVVDYAQAGEPAPEVGCLSLPFRGEGADLPALLIDLSRSLLAEIDMRDETVSDLSVNGVLETDTGLTAWGYATVARVTSAPWRPVSIDRRPEVTDIVGEVVISFPLRVDAAP